ncbi:MAG: phosphatase PAP2 family protein [Desulfovibrionaceae bacterium]
MTMKKALGALVPWLVFSAPLLLVLGWLLVAFGNSEPEVFAFFIRHREANPNLRFLLQLVSDWSNLLLYAFWAGVLVRALLRKDKPALRFVLVYVAVQVAVALVTVRLLKMTIGSPRPGEDPFLQGFTNRPSYHSMPSGHTTEATTSLLALGLLRPRLFALLGLGTLGALVGFSRIYLGWHHPTDVFCGWLLGSVGAAAVALYGLPLLQAGNGQAGRGRAEQGEGIGDGSGDSGGE